MTRAERRRLERQGVELTADERAGLRRYQRRHPRRLRRHLQQFPVDVERLERECDAAVSRMYANPLTTAGAR